MKNANARHTQKESIYQIIISDAQYDYCAKSPTLTCISEDGWEVNYARLTPIDADAVANPSESANSTIFSNQQCNWLLNRDQLRIVSDAGDVILYQQVGAVQLPGFLKDPAKQDDIDCAVNVLKLLQKLLTSTQYLELNADDLAGFSDVIEDINNRLQA